MDLDDDDDDDDDVRCTNRVGSHRPIKIYKIDKYMTKLSTPGRTTLLRLGATSGSY